MTEEEAIQLQKENQDLREALKQTQELLRVALARIEELEKLKTPPPAFVKAEVKKPASRREKAAQEARGPDTIGRVGEPCPRRSSNITCTMCPQCDLRLGGISLARCREVIDVPPPPAVQITRTSHLQRVVCRLSEMARSSGGSASRGAWVRGALACDWPA